MLKKWSINISKYFFLLIFIGFFGSITLFKHSHVVNGVSIVHSHPFKNDKDGKPSHGHSQNVYVLVHLMMNFTTTVAFSLFILNILPPGFIRLGALHSFSCHIRNYPSSICLRGPPAHFVI